MRTALISLCLVLTFFMSVPTTVKANMTQTLEGPEMWLNTTRDLTEEDLDGRIILLDFWTYCCINCIHVMPDLAYLEEKFGDKLTVIGVHSAKFTNEKDAANIRNAILRHDIKHPVVNDKDFRIWKQFDANAWPSFILLDPNGNIVLRLAGEGHRDKLEQEISNLIKDYPDAVSSPLPLTLEKMKQPSRTLDFPGKITLGAHDGKPALWIADSAHNRIIATNFNGEILTTIGSGEEGFADGSFKQAQFSGPQGLIYKDGIVYVADTENHALRKIDLADKTVTTIAGTGSQGSRMLFEEKHAASTPLISPWDIALSPNSDMIYIAMAGSHQLWSYHIAKETVQVVAGNGRESIDDGAFPFNSLSQPSGFAMSKNGLYFVDSETSSLRILQDGKIETLIGTGLFDFGLKDGTYPKARMQHPLGVDVADNGLVYIADSYNHAIRVYNPETKELTTLTGNGDTGMTNGSFEQARFNEPNDVLFYQNKLYVTDTNNHSIRVLDLESKTVRTLDVHTGIRLTPSNKAALPGLLPGQTYSAGAESTLELNLPKDWKLNADAPSYAAIFHGDELVASFDKAALEKGSVTFSGPTEDGITYKLQGTFYYCRADDTGACLVASIDHTLKDGSSPTTVRVPLKTD